MYYAGITDIVIIVVSAACPKAVLLLQFLFVCASVIATVPLSWDVFASISSF